MTCSEVSRALLEADPRELRGEGDTPMARHLHACPHCRGAARIILRGEESLAASMVEAVPASDLDQVLRRASAPPSPPPRISKRRWTRHLGLALVPLAAAAVGVGLFLGVDPGIDPDAEPGVLGTLEAPSGSAPGPPLALRTFDAGSPPPRLALQIPEGRNAAVLATDDPDITVLWFF